MAVLTLEYIKAETGEFDEESVFQAILSKRGISLIDAVNKCINLRWLDLSRNQIIRIENLDGLAKLASLDLSHNKIQKIQGLQGMPILERLKLQNNPISRTQDLEDLRAAPSLRHLQLQNVDGSDFCPVCLQPEYRRDIREMCPDLVALDSRRKHLPDLDKEAADLEFGGGIDLPEADAWFSKEDLDLSEVMNADTLGAIMQPHVAEFDAALKGCQDAFKEAEDLLKLQE